jgi:hypothetical protein
MYDSLNAYQVLFVLGLLYVFDNSRRIMSIRSWPVQGTGDILYNAGLDENGTKSKVG